VDHDRHFTRGAGVGDRTDDELLGCGVPPEWLEDVKRADEDNLLALADHLPGEAAEALLELATGGQGSVLLNAKKLPRSEVILDHERAVAALRAFAEKVSGLPLLRTYWYDGTSTGPTAQHLTLAHLDGLKVRLGFVNSVGEQKGVDSLIVTDMIALARNRAMAEAVPVTGVVDQAGGRPAGLGARA
jgi:hypothetical protein